MPAAVVRELAVLGLHGPAPGPAMAGDRGPAETVSESATDDRLVNEEDAMQYAGEAQVHDEYTGEALPPALVAKAREEEIQMMESWDVWEVITKEKAWDITGKAPFEGAVGRLQQGRPG